MKTILVAGCCTMLTLLAGATLVPTTTSLWGTGYNDYGALGTGLSNNVDTPLEIQTNGIVAIAGGGYHSLFIKSDGSLWTMGDGQSGQLGNGSNIVTYAASQIVSSNVTAISAGEFFSLFLKGDGTLWAMGDNSYGQFGNGTTNGANVPVQIPVSNIVAIAAGGYHSLFVESNGSLWTAGYNGDGELGNGSNSTTPVTTPLMIVPSNVLAVAGGEYHSLFIKTDGSLWGMGLDSQGELGDGTYGGSKGFVTSPEMIFGSNVVAIAGGGSHSLFLKNNGSLWAMGYNYSGQLGDGTTDDGNYATNLPEQIITGNVTAISAGNEHSMFLMDDGTVWAMGGNYIGQLGNGSFDLVGPHYAVFTPAQMLGGSNATAIAAGWFHSLFLVSTQEMITNSSTVTIAVSTAPPNEGSASGGGAVAEDSVNSLTATPDSGFEFIGWTGDATGTNNPLSVIAYTNLNITAYFAPVGKKLSLTVITNGDGSVAPNPDGKEFTAGRVFTLSATPAKGNLFSNWTGTITTNKNPLTIKVESSMVLQANFVTNPFLPVQGTYNGLFTTSNGVTEETAGMLKGLTVGTKGTYSGTVLFDGASHAISGTFGLDGQATNRITRPGIQINQVDFLVLEMTLNSDGPAPQITGTVTGPSWVANLRAYLATNVVPSAQYTMLIPPDTNNAPPASSPGGDGYALITNYAGTPRNPALANVKITGELADGTAFNQTAAASADGFVPVYASLYANKGLLLGWINLDLTNTASNSLTWIHPQLTSGLYPDGFTNVLLTNQILLSPWRNSPAELALLTNLSLLETIVDTNAEAEIAVTNSASGKVTGTLVTGTINPDTGLLRVAIGSAAAAKTFGYGAVLLNATNAGGYFLSKTNAQAIQLAP